MTVARLHKLLGKMIVDGHARTEVCANKDTFTHALEGDGAVILPICGAVIAVTEMLDDDGGMKVRKDGRAVLRTNLILYGESGDPETGLKEVVG